MVVGQMHRVYISVGSNMGDRLANCQGGLESLDRRADSSVRCRSPFYKTEPVDFREQDWFVNAAAEIETTLEPIPFLEILQSIQRRAGRTRDTVRFGPRILDLDIIFYDSLVSTTPLLTIPHPRMHERRFVLKPICDINPDIVHPVFHKTVGELLGGVSKEGQDLIDLS